MTDELDELDAYNDNTIHDMWVDYDNFVNTGSPGVFEELDMDDYIDSLNDWD